LSRAIPSPVVQHRKKKPCVVSSVILVMILQEPSWSVIEALYFLRFFIKKYSFMWNVGRPIYKHSILFLNLCKGKKATSSNQAKPIETSYTGVKSCCFIIWITAQFNTIYHNMPGWDLWPRWEFLAGTSDKYFQDLIFFKIKYCHSTISSGVNVF
jgi:hypothetical protein